MSLLCSSFDLENNYINPGLLSMKDFKRAIIQHFQMNEHTPSEQLNNIMERDLLEPMMTSTFTVQAHVPKETNQTNIDKLMKTLTQHSSCDSGSCGHPHRGATLRGISPYHSRL